MTRKSVAVVGAEGRIGDLVMGMADTAWRPLAVTRDFDEAGVEQPLADDRLPILVCTRNDDLPAVLERVHPTRHEDLVFVQNGMVQTFLAEHGLSGCTQGVLWVAVPRRGDPPVPGGASVFHGPWAGPIARLFDTHGVDAAVVDRTAFQREVAVKLAWICVYGAIGSATGLKVGEIAAQRGEDVSALARELHALLAREPGLDLDPDALVDRLEAYTARIPHFPASVKEWRWRNGWQLEAAERLGVPQPRMAALLLEAGVQLDR